MLADIIRERNHVHSAFRGHVSTKRLKVFYVKTKINNDRFGSARARVNEVARTIGNLSNPYLLPSAYENINSAIYPSEKTTVALRANSIEFISPGEIGPPINSDYFEIAISQWLSDTMFDSLPESMREHPSFDRIVSGGTAILPLIYASLYRQPSFLFLALEKITGENPVPEDALGNLYLTVDAWLRWIRR